MVKRKASTFDVANNIILGILALTMVYPVINLVVVSFSSITDVIAGGTSLLWPKSIDLSAYKYVLNYASLWTAYENTIFVTLVGTTINLIMSALAAYVLSERAMPGRNVLTTFVLITMFFNGGLIPTYLVVNKTGLIDSLWALIVPGAISTWNMLIIRNFFQGIPNSLKESARIDGAGELRILLQIMLPLSMPVMATMALFYGVAHWNQYSNAIIYLNSPDKRVLQVVIREMYNTAIQELDSDALPPPVETVRAATVVLATVPILLVYPFLQKYFVKGVMVGALKG